MSLADYNRVRELNSNLIETNGTLTRERDTLKTEVYNLRVANQQYYDENARFTHENAHLKHENTELRRSVSVEDGHNGTFKRRIRSLTGELERKDAEIRRIARDHDSVIRHLRLKVEELSNAIDQWRNRLADSEARREHLRRVLKEREGDVRYRDRIIAEQAENIRRLQALLDPHRWR